MNSLVRGRDRRIVRILCHSERSSLIQYMLDFLLLNLLNQRKSAYSNNLLDSNKSRFKKE